MTEKIPTRTADVEDDHVLRAIGKALQNHQGERQPETDIVSIMPVATHSQQTGAILAFDPTLPPYGDEPTNGFTISWGAAWRPCSICWRDCMICCRTRA
jgi:hypothetical protein